MSSQSERIKQRRIQLGMSQEELAFKVGTSQKQISRYERDRNDPTGEVLARLAHALNTTTDYILGITDSPDNTVNENNLDDLEIEMITLLRNHPEDARKRALSVIKAVLMPDAS
jgi:transcriptional regulator with XRE-family HTH domain